MEHDDTITALATPRGSSALAVIRVSGSSALDAFARLVRESEAFLSIAPNTIRTYRFIDPSDSTIVDEITAIKYRQPRSFTGEDMVELICHGGKVVVERILEVIISQGVRYARPGEFTRRAFLNGKTNLAKAEAINQIISSTSRQQQREAVQSYMGGYSQLLMSWRQGIEEMLIEIESEIEFGEEDDIVQREGLSGRTSKLQTIGEEIVEELAKRGRSRQRGGSFDVAIVGPQNAGKSSFLNFILGYDRSIVHSQAGTTRDVVSESLLLEGMELRFFDTAGLCEAHDSVEKIGIERSWHYLQSCDSVIWITAADEGFHPEEFEIVARRGSQPGLIAFINKTDLEAPQAKAAFLQQRGVPHLAISVLDRQRREAAIDFIREQFANLYESHSQSSMILNARQEQVIRDLHAEIVQAQACAENQTEIMALHLRNSLEKIEDFTGRKSSAEIIDSIFSQFCIGK